MGDAATCFNLIVVGAGPAGLSAAARAAARDRDASLTQPSYVVLEGHEAVAKTIQHYQKGKKVMAEPGFLELRSDLHFDEGSREEILSWWASGVDDQAINIRYNAEVMAIDGQQGDFSVTLANGDTLCAEHIVLGIGLEGNPRTLGVEGDRHPRVQYTLEDPQAFNDETVLVVGAGDSAIENALALARQNDTIILNRRDEFSRAKPGNLNAVLKAINDPAVRLQCRYSAGVKALEALDGEQRLRVTVRTPAGEEVIDCHRIIARLGAVPPRRFVESAGIVFPSARGDAVPELNARFESNVPGIYIVGSLAGYPLIKQAMNQGFDVVEYIHGNMIKSADYPLLADKLAPLPYEREVDDLLERFKRLIPMFSQLNALSFRELIIESRLSCSYADGPLLRSARAQVRDTEKATRVLKAGTELYRVGEFGTSFYIIVDGEVELEFEAAGRTVRSTLQRGQFFGESSLLSGRPHSERVVMGENCVLVEAPRRTILKLMNSNEEVRAGIDRVFVARALRSHFAPTASLSELLHYADRVETERYESGQCVYREAEVGDGLFLVRSGAVTLRRGNGTSETLVAELRAGRLFGQMALMGDERRAETAVATVASEVIKLNRAVFSALVQRADAPIAKLQADVSRAVIDKERMGVQPQVGGIYSYLLDNGLGEATNVLIIDERLCVGCDNCETACAETHGGVSRLSRRSGPTLAELHIPRSCRHCEQPHCMKDCPPNALQRAQSGEVFINDSCIGCGNCESNCPYDVIKLAYDAPPKPGLLRWMLFGSGGGPGEQTHYQPSAKAQKKGKKATKCDACVTLKGGPACVRQCPTGAAQRVSPEQFVALAEGRLQ